MTEVQHGTVEGFRKHKHWGGTPCPPCQGSMDALLGRVRALQAAVRGTIAAPAPKPAFTAVMLAKRRELAAAERPAPAPLPPVVVPATPCVGLESWMPQAPRTNLKAFRKAGWEARLTRAAGPRIAANGAVPAGKEVVYTIALAGQKGTERIIMLWQYDGEKWKLDDVLHNRRGVIKSTDLKEIL
jgi:hypothetical protein